MDNATDSSLPLNETLVEETTENSVVVVVVSSGICFLIAAVGILGNAGVVWIIINYRSMRQAVMNVYILNIGVADFVIGLLYLPEIVQFDIGWQLGEAACKAMRFVMLSCLYVSILSMLAVAFERYVAILFPMKAHALLSRHRIRAGVASIWLLSLMSAAPVLLFNRTIVIDGRARCVMALADDYETSNKWKTVYKFIEFAVFFVIPLTVQAVLYSLITRRLRQSEKGLKLLNDKNTNAAEQSNTLIDSKSQREKWRKSSAVQSRRNVIKMLIVCISVYFISHSPIQVMLFYDTFVGPVPHTWATRVVIYALLLINSAANPIIYCICSESYRSKFRALCHCKDMVKVKNRHKSSVQSGESVRTVQMSSIKVSNPGSGTAVA